MSSSNQNPAPPSSKGEPQPQPQPQPVQKNAPGDGLRSLRTSTAFRALNFELYAKPVCKRH